MCAALRSHVWFGLIATLIGERALMIEMRCPECDHLLRAGDRFAGKNVGCRYCGTVFAAPTPNAPNPPMPIRGEGRFPDDLLGHGSLPPGPTPVPTPMPMIDDAPPAPDYASPQYPTPPVGRAARHFPGAGRAILVVVLLWAAAAAVATWRLYHPIGSTRAQTPEAALHVFVRGLGSADMELMQSAARYRNPAWTNLLLQLMAENHALERDFEDQGFEAPVHIALPLGWSLPASHDLHSEAYTISQDARAASLQFHGPLTGYSGVGFVKQGLYWYIDLRPFEPMGHERELARTLAGKWQAILEEARRDIRDPEWSPERVQRALYATTLGNTANGSAALTALRAMPPAPLGALTPAEPLSQEDPLYDAVHRVAEAIHRGDHPRLQGLVSPDGIIKFSGGAQRGFWEIYTPEALARMARDTPPTLTRIVPIDRGLSEVTLRVTTATETGDTHTRYTFRKRDGYWLLHAIAPETY